MKRLMLLTLSVLLASAALSQERSDYQITQDFEKEAKAIAVAADSTNTMVDVVDVESRIAALEDEYGQYKALLDRALYPDGFEGRITKLRGQIAYAKGKINIIETQFARISELETQVRQLTGQVEKLAGENTTMLSEVKRLSSSHATIDSLKAVISRLRQGLSRRDQLIFALVDSLFLQYDKDLSAMSDKEKQGVAARLQRRNVFSSVKQSIADNVQFLESTSLNGDDIMKLTAEQQSFESKWSGLGKKIASVYVSGKSRRAREIADIDTMLSGWKQKLDGLYWKSLDELFTEHSIPVAVFRSAEEFYANLNTYLDGEIRKARDEKDGQRYFRYQAFADSVWGEKIKPSWIPSMVASGKLTREQVDSLQMKIDDWEDVVSPPLTTVYIIIGLVMLVVVLYLYRRYMMTREESKDEAENPPTA